MMKNVIVIIMVKTLLVKRMGNGYLNRLLLNCKKKSITRKNRFKISLIASRI